MKMKMGMGILLCMVITVANVSAQGHGHPDELKKILDILCGATTYKDACMKSLQSTGGNQGATPTPQMLVERGVKLALDEMEKASKLTDTLLLSKKSASVQSCKKLLQQAKERLQEAMTEVKDVNSFKDQTKLFDLRIRLGDVNTFATTCVDDISEAQAQPQTKSLTDETTYASHLDVNMLDVVTVFKQDLSHKLLRPASINNRRLLGYS